VDASDDRLIADVRGEIEAEDGILIIKRIHVRYRLRAPEDARETAERVHGVHADHCPVYRSLIPAIDITTELELESG
jgi:uncharacterized OsmC-like protein